MFLKDSDHTSHQLAQAQGPDGEPRLLPALSTSQSLIPPTLPSDRTDSDTCGLRATLLLYQVCRVGIIFVFILWLRKHVTQWPCTGPVGFGPAPRICEQRAQPSRLLPTSQLFTLREEALALSPRTARE